MNTAPQFLSAAFPLSAVADVLGITAQSVAWHFREVTHSNTVPISGKETKVFAYDTFPPNVRRHLDEMAKQTGHRDGIALLLAREKPWQPPIPLAEIAPEIIADTERRQRAMRPWLENRIALAQQMTAGEMERRAVQDYARECGHPISTRRWRHIFKRTLARDKNREEWHRVELYLPDNVRRAPVAAPASTPAPTKDATPKIGASLPELEAIREMFGDKQNPSPVERDAIWTCAIDLFLTQPKDAQPPKIKRAIVDWLLAHVPGIALNFNSARVIFDTKYKVAMDGGTPADKRRRQKGASTQINETAAKETRLVAARAGRFHKGSLAPAVRELVELGLIRNHGSADKSYVSAQIREGARRPAQIVAAFTQSQRAVKAITPHIVRDPHSTHSLKVLTADDVTPRVVCWWNSQQGTETGLGQLLAALDFRSWFVPMFSFQPEKNYNSHVVKALLANAFTKFGIWETLYLERGRIWRESKLLKGDDMKSNEWHEAHSDAEFTYGLTRQLGINFIHTLSPQAKSPVERMFGIVQRMMIGEPGFVGMDERVDLPDNTKRQLAEVRAGKAHPSKYFYHIDQWRARLVQLFEKYNHTPQQGEYLDGLTPFQAFEQFQDRNDPPSRFDARCAFLLSDQKSRRRLDHEGVIQFEVTGERYRFWNEHTAASLANAWRHCYWNPSLPDQICLTDLHDRNPVIVPRSGLTRLANPEDPITQHEMGKQRRVAAALRATYHALTAPENMVYRTPVVSPAVEHISSEIAKQTAALDAERVGKESKARSLRRKVQELGLPSAAITQDANRANDGLELMRQAKRKHRERDDESDDTPTTKTYVLSAPAIAADTSTLRKQVWSVWKRLEEIKPETNRHALTNRILGHNKPVNEFTADECERIIKVVSAIVRDGGEKVIE